MRKYGALIAVLTLLGGGAAFAHAHLDHAEPAVDSVVPEAPHQLTLWFTKELEPALCSVDVVDDRDARVDDGAAQIDGKVMRIALKPLGAGSYKVHWRAVAVDTHKTEGTFTFRVGGK